MLARLLLVASPAVVASAGCSRRDAPSGGSGEETATGASSSGQTAVPARPGARAINLSPPPLHPTGPVPEVSIAPSVGERAFARCGPEFYSWPEGRTGGPIAQPRCYQPVAPVTGCLEPTAPGLPQILGNYGSCAYDGPFAQTDPHSGAPWCCYHIGWMGTGRPLVIDEHPARASLVPADSWN